MNAIGIPKPKNDGHIVPVMAGNPVKSKCIGDTLIERYDICPQPITDLTVARGTVAHHAIARVLLRRRTEQPAGGLIHCARRA